MRRRLASPWLTLVMHSPTAIIGHTSIVTYELKLMNCPMLISPCAVNRKLPAVSQRQQTRYTDNQVQQRHHQRLQAHNAEILFLREQRRLRKAYSSLRSCTKDLITRMPDTVSCT